MTDEWNKHMSMIVNLDGSPHELPHVDEFGSAMYALEHVERTVSVFTDDPMQWIGLFGAVGDYLYNPGEPYFRQQLIGHFASIVTEIHDEYGDDEDGKEDPDE